VWTLYIVTYTPIAHMPVSTRILNFSSEQACRRIGEAFKPDVVWHCEAGKPPVCTPPAVS
jgi:hypothetical protein